MFGSFVFIIQSLISTDNKDLPFTESGGNTKSLYAAGYVRILEYYDLLWLVNFL